MNNLTNRYPSKTHKIFSLTNEEIKTLILEKAKTKDATIETEPWTISTHYKDIDSTHSNLWGAYLCRPDADAPPQLNGKKRIVLRFGSTEQEALAWLYSQIYHKGILST